MATALNWVYAEVKRPAEVLVLFLLLGGAGAWSQNGLPSPGFAPELERAFDGVPHGTGTAEGVA